MKTIKYIKNIIGICLMFSIVSGCGDDDSVAPTDQNNNNNVNTRITGFHYSFDESGSTIVDSSSNGYDADAVSISRVQGKVGSAVQFLGQGSTIELTILDYYPFANGFTFMAWMKTDHAITAREQIIGGMTGSGTAEIVDNFGISLVNDSISFEVPSQQNKITIQSTSLSLPTDTWFHIAVTYNGDLVSFYYNGFLVSTGSILTSFDDYFSNQIGNNQRIFGGIQIEDQFLGFIDELYLENTVMTETEIHDYYTSTN